MDPIDKLHAHVKGCEGCRRMQRDSVAIIVAKMRGYVPDELRAQLRRLEVRL